jgi:hypothetical protein
LIVDGISCGGEKVLFGLTGGRTLNLVVSAAVMSPTVSRQFTTLDSHNDVPEILR